MHTLADVPVCAPPVDGFALLLDGPLSAVVIILGTLGNLYCLFILYRTSIHVDMLVALTALAVWDGILLCAAMGHHSMWATMYMFGFYHGIWDTYRVALDGLMECAHLTSTWMLLQVSAARFFAVSRPFSAVSSKSTEPTCGRIMMGMVRTPLAVTVFSSLITIPCSFEFVLHPCICDNIPEFEMEENEWAGDRTYFVLYRTVFLSILKTIFPFSIISILTINTLHSMKLSMNTRASILQQQGQGLLFEVDRDKTKSLQTISTLLLAKFLILRFWPTLVVLFRVLLRFENSPTVSRATEFLLLLNSATNSMVFVVLKSAFESRRLKKIRTRQRELVMRHAEQVLSIGRMLAVRHEEEDTAC